MTDLFTPDERYTVLLCLKSAAGKPEKRLWYVGFILPSMLFALYGLFAQDFVAMLVAYVALLAVGLMYLGRNTKRSEHLRTALEKYEGKVGALRQPAPN